VSRKVIQLTDWLPPEFSAVSQYALLIAEQYAIEGDAITVIGLRSSAAAGRPEPYRIGAVSIIPVLRRPFSRRSWVRRLLWTVGTDLVLIAKAWREIRAADVVRFTGSPPFLLHFLVPLNFFLRKKLIYRITDFYPECIIAALEKPNRLLEWFRRLTIMMRRRVHEFEVIGEDMKLRLLECNIDADRIFLKRDMSPVSISSNLVPLPRPTELRGRKAVLYSGNWGVAHDTTTFLEGYRLHHETGSGSVVLWLNATGSGADEVDARLREANLPFYRQMLVPLEHLGKLLISPDVHLITLKPRFVGYVLPSKVYGCIASRKPVIFIGPKTSDVHRLCSHCSNSRYIHIDAGQAKRFAEALELIGTSNDFAAPHVY
jgi:hypothetical protein